MQIEHKIDNKLNIGGVLKFSTLDYPGKLSAVIFCQGCPNRCVYCHNPEFIPFRDCEEKKYNDVLEFLATRRGLLDAVVFSGGEPLMQVGLHAAMKRIKEMGFLIGLHTSGYTPEKLSEVIGLTDWVGFDIKAVFDKYTKITRAETSGVMAEQSLNKLIHSNISYEIRTTFDSRNITFDDLTKIAYMLKERGVTKWILQECILRGANDNQRLKLPSAAEITLINKIIKTEIRKQ